MSRWPCLGIARLHSRANLAVARQCSGVIAASSRRASSAAKRIASSYIANPDYCDPKPTVVITGGRDPYEDSKPRIELSATQVSPLDTLAGGAVSPAGALRPLDRGPCARMATHHPRPFGRSALTRPARPRTLARCSHGHELLSSSKKTKTLLAVLVLCVALGGCGGTVHRAGSVAVSAGRCPGASGARCPYREIVLIGRRGGGVLRCPEALAFSPSGDLYVGDQFSHLVQRFSPAGRFLSQWGVYGAGPGQLGAVDGLAVAPSGDVYVLDATHARIERFTPAGRLLGEWGSPGTALGQFDFGPGYGPDKPPGGDLAIGGGYVYVADSANNRIVRFDLDGTHPQLIAGPGSAPGQVSSPRGLAISGGVLYVADEGNHRVQALTLTGRPLHAEGTFGKGPTQFVNPFGVAVDGSRVYVVDDNNNRIALLTRTLRPLESWNGAGTPLELSYIRAAALSPTGDLYVADTGHERIVVFDRSGRPRFAFGTPGITPGQLIAPLALAAGAPARLLVAETYGSRSPVYLFDSTTRRGAGTSGPGGSAGAPAAGVDPAAPTFRYSSRIERGGGAIIGSHWFGPTAAAFAPDGSIWITDPRNDLVRHLSASGAFLGALGQAATGTSPPAAGDLLEPQGVAVAPSGVVYVADTGHGRIVSFAPSGAPLGALGAGLLTRPVALAVGPHGDLYVADAAAGRVVVLSPAGTGVSVLGAAGPASARLHEPAGVAVDSAGHVFVADRAASRIFEFFPSGRLVAAWGSAGGAPGQLDRPTSLALDCAGDLLVADTANNRVQLFARVGAPAAGAACGG
jgi:tripartite motif-containing protein 71